MKIHVGFDLTYESALSTPMIFMLNVHPSRAHDLITPDRLRITPSRAISPYIDGFGNKCVRILALPGQLRVACDTIVADSGKPDRVDLSAEQHAVADLPHDALVYENGKTGSDRRGCRCKGASFNFSNFVLRARAGLDLRGRFFRHFLRNGCNNCHRRSSSTISVNGLNVPR
jgi:hypothetical protein